MSYKPSDPYQPSNGTEGVGFLESWCRQCERDKAFWQDDRPEDGCRIVALAMLYKAGDEEYPREWTYDEEGKPCCTAFVELGKPVPTELELEQAGQMNLMDHI